MVNMISVSPNLRNYFLCLICIFIFISLNKQVLEQQTVDWYFGFTEMSWGCFPLFLYPHCIAFGMVMPKTTQWGVGTMVRVLGFWWVDTQKSVILQFFSGGRAVHMFMVETQRACIFLIWQQNHNDTLDGDPEAAPSHLSCSFIHHSHRDTHDSVYSLGKRHHCSCLLIFWKTSKTYSEINTHKLVWKIPQKHYGAC